MNITDPRITAKAAAARIEDAKADKVATFYCALLVLTLAAIFNTI